MARGSVEFELTVPVDVLQAAGRRDVLSKLSNVIAYFSQYVFIGSTIKNDYTNSGLKTKGQRREGAQTEFQLMLAFPRDGKTLVANSPR